MVENLAVQYLEAHNETLEDYDGFCGELVDQMMHWLGEDKISILYISPSSQDFPLNDEWRYHMVAVIDGLVHDAWFPELILPPKKYVEEAFWCGEPIFEIKGFNLKFFRRH